MSSVLSRVPILNIMYMYSVYIGINTYIDYIPCNVFL